MKTNESGFAHAILIVAVVILFIGGAIFYVASQQSDNGQSESNASVQSDEDLSLDDGSDEGDPTETSGDIDERVEEVEGDES